MNHKNTIARVLALDLATTCGWATIANGIITSGSQDFHSKPGKGSPGDQFARFENWLKERIRDDKPDAIAYEEVCRWAGYKAAHVFCGFRAILLMNARRLPVICHPYAPNVIKKAWTGKGNADKAAMMAETLRRFPALDLTDDNEADAIAILHLHLAGISTWVPFT